MLAVRRASKWRSHSLDARLPSSRAFFHVPHEDRAWGQMGYGYVLNWKPTREEWQPWGRWRGWHDRVFERTMKLEHNAGGRRELPRDRRAGAHEDAVHVDAAPVQYGREDPLFPLESASAEHRQGTRPLSGDKEPRAIRDSEELHHSRSWGVNRKQSTKTSTAHRDETQKERGDIWEARLHQGGHWSCTSEGSHHIQRLPPAPTAYTSVPPKGGAGTPGHELSWLKIRQQKPVRATTLPFLWSPAPSSPLHHTAPQPAGRQLTPPPVSLGHPQLVSFSSPTTTQW